MILLTGENHPAVEFDSVDEMFCYCQLLHEHGLKFNFTAEWAYGDMRDFSVFISDWHKWAKRCRA